MKKKISILFVAFILFFSVNTFAENVSQSEEDVVVTHGVSLLVKEKDPAIAYGRSLMPLVGPISSAKYLAYNPIDWKGENNEYLNKKAIKQTIWNVIFIGTGIVLDISDDEEVYRYRPEYNNYIGEYEVRSYVYTESGDIGLYTLIGYLGAMAHNHFFGEEMADEAVEYNKELYKRFKWDGGPKFEYKF